MNTRATPSGVKRGTYLGGGKNPIRAIAGVAAGSSTIAGVKSPQIDRRGYAAVGLHMPKTPANVGSVLRAAHCYGVALVAQTGKRYHSAATDTMKAYRHLPLLNVDDLFAVVPNNCVPVAVDLLEGACSLVNYTHPERAFYIFGPEDGTLGKAITDRCRDKVFVPTAFCMNLAAAVNVVLYDRAAKQAR